MASLVPASMPPQLPRPVIQPVTEIIFGLVLGGIACAAVLIFVLGLWKYNNTKLVIHDPKAIPTAGDEFFKEANVEHLKPQGNKPVRVMCMAQTTDNIESPRRKVPMQAVPEEQNESNASLQDTTNDDALEEVIV
ncbi:Aste57867_25378 [Aphanomyces stellatus]|uniref:Aste57867_25378 protein n=1 Tax=Aphanomyces stellatus TaxID=120398 RepID=A0A485LSW8_9STRA|nr:hypothetical protein As57867_025299 [Aphanomyces stellatus]VFU02003.1 Aste57867_25378 [Aphanomyces stellatus]